MQDTPGTHPLADIGVYGLGVMGTSLARNLARHGSTVALFNYTPDLVDRFTRNHIDEGSFLPATDITSFASSLSRPRIVLAMVAAGPATESVINQLSEVLEPGDIVIDGGNTHYTDTVRREADLADKGIRFVGMGVSGGEEGALLGPSLMPGGDVDAYRRIGPLLESIAAQVDGSPCCAHVGPGGAGHFVKTVHNGIEYADMQVIAEAYEVLRSIGRLSVPEIAEVFRSWKDSELDSYLIEVTAEVLERTDPDSGHPFVDIIVDAADQKGTGTWSTQNALEFGVAVPAIAEATFARSISSASRQRDAMRRRNLDSGAQTMSIEDRACFIDDVRRALYGAKIAAYAQGFDEIATVSEANGWGIDLGAMAKIWRGGCIIRARFLDDIVSAYEADAGLPTLLTAPRFAEAVEEALPAWRRITAQAILTGTPTPVFASSLSYIDQLRAERLPAALIQAQRDYFGAHTYRRIDDPGTAYHVLWSEEGRPEVKKG